MNNNKLECLYNYMDNLKLVEEKRVSEIDKEISTLAKRIEFLYNYRDNVKFFEEKTVNELEKEIKGISKKENIESYENNGYINQYNPRTLDLIYYKSGYSEDEILDIRIECINKLMTDVEAEKNNLLILKEDLMNGTHKLQLMDLKKQILYYTELLNEYKQELRINSEDKKSIKLNIARLNMKITSLKETVEIYEKQDKELELKRI